MLKKFGFGMLAAVMAIAFSAFKTTQQSATAQLKSSYYWYQVDLATQKIPQNAVPFDHSEDVDDCPNPGTSLDCIRGFLTQPNTSAGPVASRGEIQKMTNEQP